MKMKKKVTKVLFRGQSPRKSGTVTLILNQNSKI